VVASWTHANPSDVFALAQNTLTETQAGNITSYTDLSLEFEVTVNQGGGGHAEVTWAELEVPSIAQTHNGEISLQGQSALTAVASVTHQTLSGAVAFAGESSLAASASVTHAVWDGQIALAGESALTVVGQSTAPPINGAISFVGESFLGTIRP
jgi:hypothetical protein